jgi:Subunit CCDC53 of WASH complex
VVAASAESGSDDATAMSDLESQTTCTDEVALKDHPVYGKYFKMRFMLVREAAIENAMTREGVDHCILKLDCKKSLKSQMEHLSKLKATMKSPTTPRNTPLRKNLHLETVDSAKVKDGCVWSSVKGKAQMSKLKFDEKEFQNL